MLTTVIGKDDAGHPLYQANLTLEPRVARIEVASFEYQARLGSDGAELPRDYESISVEQIVLNNYYNQAAFVAGTVSGDKTNELIDAGTAFGFFAAAANAGLWNNDMFGTADLPAVDLAAAGDYTMAYTDGAKRPAYHFFPKADKIAADDRYEERRHQECALPGYPDVRSGRNQRYRQDLSGEVRFRRR